jgi:signal transduction histidine kinase
MAGSSTLTETIRLGRIRFSTHLAAWAVLLTGIAALAASAMGRSLSGKHPETDLPAQTLAGIGFAVLGAGLVAAGKLRNRPGLSRRLQALAGWSAMLYSLGLIGASLAETKAGLDPLKLIVFILLGLPLALPSDSALRRHVALGGIFLSLFAGGFVLTAHLYGSPFLYGLPGPWKLYWPSAVMGMLAAYAALGLKPGEGFLAFLAGDGPGSGLARWLLPAGPVLIVALGWVRLLGERMQHYPTGFGLTLFAMVNVAWFIALIGAAATVLNRGERHRLEREERIRAMNQELEAKSRGLEAANRELEAFSYSVSHDLRAPLRHIAGFGAKLEKAAGDGLDEKSRHYLDVILKSTRRMGDLIDDLLQFSRAGRSVMAPVDVRMDGLVEEVLSGLQESEPGREVQVSVGRLPDVEGDPILLRQVWANLLGNAWKYTRRTPHPRIDVTCRDAGAGVSFQVRDNGAGFDMRHADKLFGVFQRLHTESEYEGTGIGLALVRRIIERHGGSVWAEGEPGAGARFGFTLPRRAEGKEPAWSH